ncbi:hypothetical protein [Serpentinicella alkaliphila]|uniref:Lipoprotein n=1 Tax=Serpentinicella alkaliphila TaxID=1734049 RepID=A0A4R2TS02_9FIRM|nr:hypothetical protein [Serpentinicella alkaliphila]QUH25659.1 hypothetical protein HZR23_07845 [Serpentinicella alkaliphila]TCQ06630.1 hypothetical protein EDD79_100355 [Serpentinicella alkaliphila]
MKKSNSNTLIVIIMFLLVFSLFGCRGNTEDENKKNPSNSQNQMSEVPDAFVETEDMLRELIYDLDAVPGIEKALAEKEQKKAEVTETSDVDMPLDEKQETAERDININMHILQNSILVHSLFVEDIEGHAADIEVLPNSIDDIWFEINKRMSEINTKWNLIERELKKVNADQEKVKGYESVFDEATIAIQQRDRITGLNLINELTYRLAEFRRYFKDKVPSEVIKITAHNRQVVLLAYEDNYEEALQETAKIKELLNAVRNQLLERDAEDVIQKMELSIEDLEGELNKQDFYLTQLKGSIVIKNTKLMEEVFESVIKE